MRNIVTLIFFCTLSLHLFAQPDLLWAKQISSAGDVNPLCYPLSVTEDTSGNIITVGFFDDSVDLDPGAGTFYVVSTQPGSQTGFIMKQDAAGNFVWGMQITGDMVRVHSVECDDSGNVYVTGSFMGATEFDPGPGTYILNGDLNYDVFIAKYNPGGSLIWVDEIETQSMDHKMIMDDQGDLIIWGRFLGTTDFDPGAGSFNLTAPGPYAETYYIAKYTTNDQFLWAGKIEIASQQGAIYLTDIDSDDFANLYLCGRYKGATATDFDPGPGQAPMIGGTNYHSFIVKLNAAGNYIWAKQVGISPGDYNSYDRIEIGPDNMVNLLGVFANNVDLDPGTGTSIYSQSTNGDYCLSKLDTAGNLIWYSQLEAGTYNALSFGQVLAVDEKGWLYISGEFNEGTDFDPGPGVVTFSGFPSVMNQIFCAYDSTGALAWAGTLQSTAGSWVTDLDVRNGEMIMVGSFYDTMNFEVAPGFYPMIAPVAQDGYICRYSDLVLSVGENAVSETTVFPNPSGGIINIQAERKLSEVVIYDMSGRVVYTQTFLSGGNNAVIQLPISQGTYLLKCVDEAGTVSTQRFILNR